MPISKILLWLSFAFFVWACLATAGLPGEPWLIPGGLAAAVLSRLVG